MSWSFAGIGAIQMVGAYGMVGDLGTQMEEYAGAAEFDLQLALIAFRGSDAFTVPAGWTVAASLGAGNQDYNVTSAIASGLIAFRVRGTDAGDLDFVRGVPPDPEVYGSGTGGGGIARGCVIGYRDQAAASPFDAANSATLGAASVTASTSGLTTGQADELIVMLAAGARNGTWGTFDAATDPATQSGAVDTAIAPVQGAWTLRHQSGSSTGAGVSLGIADARRATAGATGALTAVCSQSARHALLSVAFKPFAARASAQGIIIA